MQTQDIFKAFGCNWKWASVSRTGKARIYTGEPVALASGLIQSPFGERVSRCEAFDRGELDTPVIWKRTDFTNGPAYETDKFGIPLPVAVPQMPAATPPSGYCSAFECFNEKAVGFNVCEVHRPPQLMAPVMPTQQMPAPAPAPIAPPKQTRLTTEEAENGGLWAFANQDEDFVHVNCDGVVWFDLFKDGPEPRRSYAVEVDGVTHVIERTRSQPQLAPPEAGKPCSGDEKPWPAQPLVPRPFGNKRPDTTGYPLRHAGPIDQFAENVFVWYDEVELVGGAANHLADAQRQQQAYGATLVGDTPDHTYSEAQFAGLGAKIQEVESALSKAKAHARALLNSYDQHGEAELSLSIYLAIFGELPQ